MGTRCERLSKVIWSLNPWVQRLICGVVRARDKPPPSASRRRQRWRWPGAGSRSSARLGCERKLELHGHRRLARGWCSWREAVLGHEAGDRFRCCCSLDPSHRPTATNARIKVGLKNVFQKPAPAPPSRRAAVITLQELELIASGGWWPALERIVFGLGNHFAAERGVTREHAEVSQ